MECGSNRLLEGFSCVKAYVNGHNHKGKYGIKKGIHYLTCKGMVEADQSAYSIFRVQDEEINVLGFGRNLNDYQTQIT